MERKFTETELLVHNLEDIKQSMKHGNLLAMRHLLADTRAMERVAQMGTAEDIELVAHARSWAREAHSYEQEHGFCSMLNLGEPFVGQVLLPALARHSAAVSALMASIQSSPQ